ncbi:MAG: asparagine synthase (glutamine-hydrolyzing) [Nanoarchaeota archaeon]|nr:asparagine synthase (glutamine-hydrolyzing) [Nanoarchaeota archaeon]
MCGIAGMAGMEDKALLGRMLASLSHRGPDDSGTYQSKGVLLGHRRLSIIDLSTGKQPIFNEDGDSCVIFNGEIYNYRELRKELEKKGHRFSTQSDTETIVHAYEEYGEECVLKLNGEFAFAIWDDTKKRLFLARDRAGVKPLFYAPLGNAILFASEVKAILQHESVKKDIDTKALHQLLNLRYIAEDRTMFTAIKKLLPGHTLTWSRGKFMVKRYWKPELKIIEKPEAWHIAKLRATLETTMERYAIADVPVGAFLSGGLDTSTVVALMSPHLKEMKTFCMGFNQPTDEFKDARTVSEKFGTDHREMVIETDLVKELPRMIWSIDSPKRNLWPYFVNKAVAKHTKVVVGGSGGDEVLGGYIYRYQWLEKTIEERKKAKAKQISEARKAAATIISSQKIGEECKLKEFGKLTAKDNAELYTLNAHENKLFSSKEYLKKVYGESLKPVPEIKSLFVPYFKDKNQTPVENMMVCEFASKMPDDLLSVDDATSMAHSLEARSPFLDAELIETCFAIPTRYKIADQGKMILRKAMRGVLPKETLEKKKWGFIPNTQSLYQNELKGLAKDILPQGSVVKEGYLKKDFIQKILASKPSDKLTMHYNYIWAATCFELWHRMYIEGDVRKPELKIDALL